MVSWIGVNLGSVLESCKIIRGFNAGSATLLVNALRLRKNALKKRFLFRHSLGFI